MRIKFTLIGVFLAFILVFSGCGGSQSAAIGGALAGGAASQTFLGIQADLEQARQAKLVELQTAVDQLDAATDETEKTVLEAKVRSLEGTIENLQAAQSAAELTKQGVGLDWKDPAAVSGYGGTLAAAIIALLYRNKGKVTAQKYQAHKAGVERFFLTNEDLDQVQELYDSIGAARAKLDSS